MADRALISRFTPSRTPAEVLEQILVQRQDLIADAVERISDSALEGGTHHLLFVGPRGIGKTHLISLINHRVQQSQPLQDKLRSAWLNEDETATTFLELLLRIHRALSTGYPQEFPKEQIDAIYDLSQGEAERQLKQRILDGLGKHKLLILVENLDRLFSDLGLEGQQHFRAFLQENPVSIIVATSQQLVEGIADRKSPFFGFFQIEHLAPLSLVESRELLKQIGTYHEDQELVEFLETPEGRSRLEAIYHLSGGNHRVYIVLSEFISRESLDELVTAFEKMLDELTPYYQEKLRSLSAQQRKLVEFLCRCERPTPVKEIARQLFISEQTASRQLKELRDRGYVVSNPSGSKSLYELSEPLLRLCVEVKENNREPIRLIVRFLREWYTTSQLESVFDRRSCSVRAWEYVRAALSMQDSRPSQSLASSSELNSIRQNVSDASRMLIDEFQKDSTTFFGLFETCATEEERTFARGVLLQLKQLEMLESASIDEKVGALVAQGVFSGYLGNFVQAKAYLAKAVEISDAAAELKWISLIFYARTLGETHDYSLAIENLDRAISMRPHGLGQGIRCYRAELLVRVNKWEQACKEAADLLSQAATSLTEPMVGFIDAILQSTSEDLWRSRLERFVSLFEQAEHLEWLADSLVRSMKHLKLTGDLLQAWKQAWEEVIGDKSELQVARRIFATGIDYLATKDPQVLGELVSEERRILIDALELDKEKSPNQEL
jgi:DNA-binding MarR family transcriptional regulator